MGAGPSNRNPSSDAKQACLVRESTAAARSERTRGKLLGGSGVAEQNRDAAAVAGAFHVDRGVADKPDLVPGRRRRSAPAPAATGARAGLSSGASPAPTMLPNKSGPAEPRDLAPQQSRRSCC